MHERELPDPEWLSLPPEEWPASARHAYGMIVEWHRKLSQVRSSAADRHVS